MASKGAPSRVWPRSRAGPRPTSRSPPRVPSRTASPSSHGRGMACDGRARRPSRHVGRALGRRPGGVEQADSPRASALVLDPGGRGPRRTDRHVRADTPRRSRHRPLCAAAPPAAARRLPARDHGARDRPPRLLSRRPRRRRAPPGAHSPRPARQAAAGADGGQPLRGSAHQRPPPALRRARSRRRLARAGPDRGGEPALDAVHEHLRAPLVAPPRRAVLLADRRAHRPRRRSRG